MLTLDAHPLLTPEQCARVVAFGNAQVLNPGYMKDPQGDNYLAPSIRQSQITFLNPNADEFVDIAVAIATWAYSINQNLWKAELDEGEFIFQFARYDGSKSDFHAWHPDEPLWDGLYRGKKLSFVTQLSAPEDYDGGVLELQGRDPTPKGVGLTVGFPTFLPHRVTPVTRGVRYSLVSWAKGPHWR